MVQQSTVEGLDPTESRASEVCEPQVPQPEVASTAKSEPGPLIRDRILEFRRVPAPELLANPKNWRRHPKAQADALRGLLSEIGYADAMLARELPDGQLMLIDGHLRKETTPDAQLPVLVLDVNAEEADKLLLTLDPLASLAESDAERIGALLQTVRTDSPAVEDLFRRAAGDRIWNLIHPQSEPPAQIDQAGELQKKWNTEAGQLWRIGDHRLLCGDATKSEDVARLMGEKRAVLFATDPPYAVGYSGGSHPQSWGNKGAANRDKDWSDRYVEAKSADVKNSEESGVESLPWVHRNCDQMRGCSQRRLVHVARIAPPDDARGYLERVRRLRPPTDHLGEEPAGTHLLYVPMAARTLPLWLD